MQNYILIDGTLYHHGIMGQKWGRRRFQNEDGSLTEEGKRRYGYDEAKKQYKILSKENKALKREGSKHNYFAGRRNTEKLENLNKRINENEYKKVKLAEEMTKSKAISKGKSQDKIDKAVFNTYLKEYRKSGLSGSLLDIEKNGRSTYLFDQIAKDKGKEYAYKIEDKIQNRAVATLVGSTIVAVGGTLAQMYLANNYYYK